MGKEGGALRAVEEGPRSGRAVAAEPAAPAPDAGLPAGLLDFTPVPRRYRHDGWTPERQKAFIGWLAVTGCVERAARMVNIAQTNCCELRRAPGAEGFRPAWDAALRLGGAQAEGHRLPAGYRGRAGAGPRLHFGPQSSGVKIGSGGGGAGGGGLSPGAVPGDGASAGRAAAAPIRTTRSSP